MSMGMMMRRKKMASGGSMPCAAHGMEMCDMCHGGKMMAEGGLMEEEASGYPSMPSEHDEMNESADHEDDEMIARIMKKRMMSKGGQVANDTSPITDSKPAQYDDLVLRDDLESSYTGANSGDYLGNEQLDKDEHDIISRIMKKRKDKNPRPA